jgi:hypothetical protein
LLYLLVSVRECTSTLSPINTNMYANNFPKKRYKLTLKFLRQHIAPTETILDLGVENPFSELLKTEGFKVKNTSGEDLDLDISALETDKSDVVTAFEIFEHLLSPFTVLQNIQSKKLVASIPLKLWFASAYRSKTDPRDRHFHEFESWQFDWLLEKAGWKIIASEQWTNPTNKIGFRPLLRWFTPRYYIVYAERI